MVKQFVRRCAPLGSSSSKTVRGQGLTLVELLVALVILSILASAALPYAEVTVRRDKELELRRSLREIRTAIDAFHQDWKDGNIPKTSDAASADGYPKTLQVLVDGVQLSGATGKRRYYLRRVPRDPFADQTLAPADQWVLRSYQDPPDTVTWGGQDVYDVHSGTDRTALDGSKLRDW